MERKINLLSTIYLLFLALLFLSGALGGVLGEVVYFLAFLLPFAVFIVFQRRNEGIDIGYLRLDGGKLLYTLLLSAPTVLLIMLVSALTSMLIFAVTGHSNNVDIGNSLPIALVAHALLPSLLEEMLFRFIPIQMLSSHSKRATVLLSAFFFAMIHHSLFSIPYAFIAGIVFVSLDLALGSIWPSVIIHLLNNMVSVLLTFGLGYIVLPMLLILCVISAIIIAFNFSKIKNLFASVICGGEKFSICPHIVAFTAVTVIIAVLTLF